MSREAFLKRCKDMFVGMENVATLSTFDEMGGILEKFHISSDDEKLKIDAELKIVFMNDEVVMGEASHNGLAGQLASTLDDFDFDKIGQFLRTGNRAGRSEVGSMAELAEFFASANKQLGAMKIQPKEEEQTIGDKLMDRL
jgi:hypothetical protein